MKHLVLDELNIKNEPMDKTVTRVKMFILNKNNEYVMVSAFDGLQLPGGHVENDEDLSLAVIREVEEETGIRLTEDETPVPFCKIERYTKSNDGTNRLSIIHYYFIKTQKEVDLSKRNLTEHEKENNYSIKFIKKEDLENELETLIQSCPNLGSRVVAGETLFAYKILNEVEEIKNNETFNY